MKLIFAGKLSVAQSIATAISATDRQDGYLQGSGYIVTWCEGHLAGWVAFATHDTSFAK